MAGFPPGIFKWGRFPRGVGGLMSSPPPPRKNASPRLAETLHEMLFNKMLGECWIYHGLVLSL